MTRNITPDDLQSWKQVALADIAEFSNGKPYENFIDQHGKNLLITLDSVDIYGELKSQHKRTNVEDNSLREGDIVTVLSDLAHGYLLGLSALIPKEGCYILNQRMGRLRTKETVSSAFLRLWINAHQLHFRNRGQGTSQRHIYKRDFYSLEVKVPPLKEQQAIVDAVTDTNNLIKSLDLLIAKSREIKQGAMQQLLTGKTRLPGFNSEWVSASLGSISQVVMGQSPLGQYYNTNGEGLPLIQGNADVSSRQTYVRTWTTQSPKTCEKGEVIMTVRAPVGYVARAHAKIALGRGVCAFRNPTIDNDFMYQALIFAENVWEAISQGTTFTAANANEVNSFKLLVPSDRVEQSAIAEVLMDMDTEIDSLVARREKSALIKTGMIQALLTGRTRLL